MKVLVPSLVVVCAGFGIAYSIHSNVDANPAPAAAAVQEAPVAGPEHAMLQKLVGTWDAVVITNDETGAEQRSKGATSTVKHTDFHTIDSFLGDFMGMPFKGNGVNGYCQVKKQFFTFWTDSMTPSPVYLTGQYDAKKREMAMTGECFGMTGKLEPCRTVTQYKDDDHYNWAMYMTGPDGKEMRALAIEYTRRK
jgi:hypothetical protein